MKSVVKLILMGVVKSVNGSLVDGLPLVILKDTFEPCEKAKIEISRNGMMIDFFIFMII